MQGMRRVGGNQMGGGTQALAVGQCSAAFTQRQLGGQGCQRCLAGTHKATGLQMRERFQQALVHGALFLLHAPAAGLMRHLQQRSQRAQCGIDQRKAQKEQDDGQIQRHVHPVG